LVFAVVYLLMRRLLWALTGSSSDVNREVELLVLLHQLQVLGRQVGRSRLRGRDRLLMAALSTTLPRARWASFLVEPAHVVALASRTGAPGVDLSARVRRRQAADEQGDP
jgi:hypothetical protein